LIIIYLIFIAVFLFYTFFNLYHILKFGFVSIAAYLITFSYIVITILALFVSYLYKNYLSEQWQLTDSLNLAELHAWDV